MDYFDLSGCDTDRVYALLAGLVTPRPIAWVTSVDAEGRVNAAPFSFFNLLGVSPPVVALGVGDREDGTPKDTALNIAETGEFVVNLVDEALCAAMVSTAREVPRGVSELEQAGLSAAPSRQVRAPRVEQAPASLECRLLQTLSVGENRIFLARVLAAHVRDGVVDVARMRVRAGAHAPVGRLHSPDGYCRTVDRFSVAWPE